jgi:hypothetical protein
MLLSSVTSLKLVFGVWSWELDVEKVLAASLSSMVGVYKIPTLVASKSHMAKG